MESDNTYSNIRLWSRNYSTSSIRRPWTGLLSLTAVTLSAGILVAIGHHLFYHFLNGQRVDHVIPQAWVINIATAMTFLCKTFLILATATAFVQCMFNDLRHKCLKVREVDSLSQVLGNPFELLVLNLWSKVPIACLVAVVTWFIPIAAIFPPGTLSVTFIQDSIKAQGNIAMLDFDNVTNYVSTIGSVASRSYSDASGSVYKAILSSGTTGQVLSIPHSHVNMSYNAEFYGPAIQCGNASRELNQTASEYLYNAGGNDGDYLWVAFVGGDDLGLFNMTPCHNVTIQNATYCQKDELPSNWFDDTINLVTLDTTSTDASRLYVWTGYNAVAVSNLLECKLTNASYSVDFEFGVNKQTTTISKVEYHNDVAAFDPTAQIEIVQCPNPNSEVECLAPNPVPSYQAVMQAFNSLFVGSIWGSNLGFARQLTLVQTTPVAQNFSWEAPFNDHLGKDLESLFQNITLSLLSFEDLRADDTNTSAVPVMIFELPATYQYRPLNLYLAYGLSILFATICAIIGLMARQSNGGSYTNKFSTYVRVAVNAGLPDMISSHDSGANPCPQDVRDTGIRLDDESVGKLINQTAAPQFV